jgi:hypothetical protein
MGRTLTSGRGGGVWGTARVPLTLVIVSVGLGWIGFYRYFAAAGEPIPVLEALFHAAGLPLLETTALETGWEHVPLELHIARIIGMLVVPYAFVLAFLALFGDVVRPWRVRSWASRGQPYTVVCGLGWRGFELVQDLAARRERIAVVEQNPDNGLLAGARDLGAIHIAGDATRLSVLRSAGVAAASRIFVMGGSDEMGIRMLKQIVAAVGSPVREEPILCSVEIADERTREFVHRTVPGGSALVLSTFDTYETTARQLIERWPVDRGTDGVVGVIVVGWSPVAQALLEQALLIGHFAPGRSLRVTVLTQQPESDRARFLELCPCFRGDSFAGNPDAERLRQQVLAECVFDLLPDSDTLLLADEGPLLKHVTTGAPTTIYVCIDDGLRSAAHVAALLPSLASVATERDADVQLFYYYDYPEDEHWPAVEQNLRRLAPGIEVHSFGNFLDGCSVDRIQGRPADDVARGIAEFYRREYGGETWERLTEPDRISNRRSADHVAVKLHAVGAFQVRPDEDDPSFLLSEDEIVMLADMEHRRWCAEKLLAGWRPLPRTAQNLTAWNADKERFKAQKLHIALAPFDVLDEHDRGKDLAQIRSIPTILRGFGKGVRRADASAPALMSGAPC